MKASDFIAASLSRFGVDCVFYYPGAGLVELESAARRQGLDLVLMRVESSLPHAASGFFQASGKIAACFASSGPGALNMFTALAAAKADGVPLIAFTANVSIRQRGKKGFQDFDVASAAMPFVKRAFEVSRVDGLRAVIEEAFLACVSGKPGPVLIDIPRDLFDCEVTDVPACIQRRVFKPRKFFAGGGIPVSFGVVVSGNGLHKYEFLDSVSGQFTLVSSDKFGCMGFSIPAAVGACVAGVGSVLLVCGDGDFQMAQQELATIAQYSLPVNILIVNNNSLGAVDVIKKARGEGSIGFFVPCLRKLADSFGFTYSVTNSFSISPCSGPSLIEMPSEVCESAGLEAVRRSLNASRSAFVYPASF
ncbi:MAG: thiamine pyrophosphate-binding protein [Candidatus Micrarchaeota archaeon]